jgi:hypothetical protein
MISPFLLKICIRKSEADKKRVTTENALHIGSEWKSKRAIVLRLINKLS